MKKLDELTKELTQVQKDLAAATEAGELDKIGSLKSRETALLLALEVANRREAEANSPEVLKRKAEAGKRQKELERKSEERLLTVLKQASEICDLSDIETAHLQTAKACQAAGIPYAQGPSYIALVRFVGQFKRTLQGQEMADAMLQNGRFERAGVR